MDWKSTSREHGCTLSAFLPNGPRGITLGLVDLTGWRPGPYGAYQQVGTNYPCLCQVLVLPGYTSPTPPGAALVPTLVKLADSPKVVARRLGPGSAGVREPICAGSLAASVRWLELARVGS